MRTGQTKSAGKFAVLAGNLVVMLATGCQKTTATSGHPVAIALNVPALSTGEMNLTNGAKIVPIAISLNISDGVAYTEAQDLSSSKNGLFSVPVDKILHVKANVLAMAVPAGSTQDQQCAKAAANFSFTPNIYNTTFSTDLTVSATQDTLNVNFPAFASVVSRRMAFTVMNGTQRVAEAKITAVDPFSHKALANPCDGKPYAVVSDAQGRAVADMPMFASDDRLEFSVNDKVFSNTFSKTDNLKNIVTFDISTTGVAFSGAPGGDFLGTGVLDADKISKNISPFDSYKKIQLTSDSVTVDTNGHITVNTAQVGLPVQCKLAGIDAAYRDCTTLVVTPQKQSQVVVLSVIANDTDGFSSEIFSGNVAIPAILATTPTVTRVTSSNTKGAMSGIGAAVNVQVIFSENVSVTGMPLLNLAIGGTAGRSAIYVSGSGSTNLNFVYTVAMGDFSGQLDYSSANALTLSGGTIVSGSNVNANLALPAPASANALFSQQLVIDGLVPAVTSVKATSSSGTYSASQIIGLSVVFSKPVVVSGSPVLLLAAGAGSGIANYVSGSGTNTLNFSYTVLATDNTSKLDYTATNALALNGGVIADLAANNADLTLPVPGTASSISGTATIVINNAPVLSNIMANKVFPYGAVDQGTVQNYDFNNNISGDDSGMTYSCSFRRMAYPLGNLSGCAGLAGVTLNASTGVLNIVPNGSDWGSYEIDITGTKNGSSSVRSAVFNFREPYSMSNLLVNLDAGFAAMDRPGQNDAGFVPVWKNLMGNAARDASLSNFSSAGSWQGDGTAASPQALVFDGNNSFASLGMDLNSQNSVMFDTWINPSAIRPSDVVLSNGDANGHGITLRGSSTTGKYKIVLGDGTVTTQTSYVSTVLADHPHLFWQLGEASGPTAMDSSGNNVQGTFSGNYILGQPGAIAGEGNTAVTFSDASGMILTTNSGVAMNATVEVWAKSTNLTNSMLWLTNGGSPGPDLFFYSNTLSLNTWDSGDNSFCAIPAFVSDGNYHHYVTVMDISNSTSTLYVDGNVCGTAAYRNPSNGILAFSGGQANFGWQGSIDDPAVYNAVLSPSQILAHYNAARGTGTASACEFTPTANTWQHVVGIYDSTTNTLSGFVNGAQVCSVNTSGSYAGSSMPLTIGKATTTGTTNWYGKMGALRVYSSGSTTDVVANYNATRSHFGFSTFPTSGLVTWFKIDDATPGATLFSDSSLTTSVNADGGPVGTWKDLGSGNHGMFQPNMSARPTLALNAVNGHAALTMDGNGQYLYNENQYTQPFTFFVVSRMLTGGPHARVFGAHWGNWLLGFWGGDRATAYLEGWLQNATSPVIENQWEVDSVTADNNGGTYYSFGNQGNSGGPNAAPDGLEIGGTSGNTERSHSQVAEILGFNRVLTSAELAAVNGYLLSRFALTAPSN